MAQGVGTAAHLSPSGGSGRVVALYTCARGGDPMVEHRALRALAGIGIEGDRYATAHGYWSFERRYVDQITLIEAEAIEAVSRVLARPFGGAEARRNVVTRGVELSALIGERFAVGEAELEGLRPCDPCAYLDRLLGFEVRRTLEGRGGLRAAIVRGGTLRHGDPVTILPRA